jgi:hypothetical protein
MKSAPTNDNRVDTLQTRARDLYRRASREVDTATAARLRAARSAALDAASKPHMPRWMMPAGAVAVAALAVVVAWQPLRHLAPTPAPHAVSTGSDLDADLPPDADSADPALYQNLDFYAWLAQQPKAKRPAGG